MARVHVTAVYDTRGAAETARDELVKLGVAEGDIAIAGTHEPLDTDEPTGQRVTQPGLWWGGFAGFFVPEEDRAYYEEGVRRGGFMLSAQIDESLEPRAHEVLEQFEPLNLEEEGQNWRRTGWPGHEPGTTETVGTGPGGRRSWKVRSYREENRRS